MANTNTALPRAKTAGFSRLSQGHDDQETFTLKSLSSDVAEVDPIEKTKSLSWRSKFHRQDSDNKNPFDDYTTYVNSPLVEHGRHHSRRHNTGDHSSTNDRRASRLSQYGQKVSNIRLPKFVSPWQHEVDPDHHGKRHNTVRRFNPKAQHRRMFIYCVLQWLVTVVITAAMAALIFGFSRPYYITKNQKYTYNAGITLLSLCTGLSVVTGFRCYAKMLSWRLLAGENRTLQDFELIMNCDSQSEVLKLFWASRKRGKFWLTGTQLLCVASLTLVIGLQIVIGMLGLTYSIDTSSGHVELVRGRVQLADLTNIYQDPTYNVTEPLDQQGAANVFGLAGQSYILFVAEPGSGNGRLDSVYATVDNNANTTTNPSPYFYQFVAQNPDPDLVVPVVGTTDRAVTTDASCVKLKIVSGGFVENDTVPLVYNDEHGHERSIYVTGMTVLTTTWMSNSSVSNCGPRCTNILGLNTGSKYDNGTVIDQPMLFSCNSTVSNVTDTESCQDPTYCQIADEQAKTLAGAIGWTGSLTLGDDLQYHTYPPGSPFSWDGSYTQYYTNATWMADFVCRFSVNAIAAMDSSDPFQILPGYFPALASQLSVEWHYTIPILLVIPGVQFIVLLLVCAWANGAIVKDSSHLANARLLRPIVEKLDDHGCVLTGDEIARELGNLRIVYGVRSSEGGADATTGYSGVGGVEKDWHLGVIFQEEGFGASAEEGWCVGLTER
ncbi:hypothetical protein LTR66_016516 [Elasticomyces elasticus]|nr:hypothetical protein LTR66_016516 [Elasticomyces elasticus]